jgi:DNA sulfur modification protein DndC
VSTATSWSITCCPGLTIDSLNAYGPRHKHWAIAWSGGKDSTTLVTLVVYLIESGKVPRPEDADGLYADTRMELLPLWVARPRSGRAARARHRGAAR